MKLLLLLRALLFASLTFGQSPCEISDEDYERMEKKTSQLILEKKTELDALDYISTFHKNLEIEFTLDTLEIEVRQRLAIDYDYSTMEMQFALLEAESGYDSLLNKYYNLIRGNLTTEDKKTLRDTQINWIKYRDSDMELLQVTNILVGGQFKR